MMTKLIKELKIVLKGDVHPTTIPAGTELEPNSRVLEVAEQLGITDTNKKPKTSKKAMTPPENKAV